MPKRRAAANSGAVASEGIAVSNQPSAAARSASYQRGKKVVSASSGKTTTSAPRRCASLHQPDHAADGDLAALGALDGAELGGGEGEGAWHAVGVPAWWCRDGSGGRTQRGGPMPSPPAAGVSSG